MADLDKDVEYVRRWVRVIHSTAPGMSIDTDAFERVIEAANRYNASYGVQISSPTHDHRGWETAPEPRCTKTRTIRCIRPSGHNGQHQMFQEDE